MKNRSLIGAMAIMAMAGLILFVGANNIFALPPEPATIPQPADSATYIQIDQILYWDASPNADNYNVYFGIAEDLDLVSGNFISPPTSVDQSGTSYNPGTLDYNTTYYWQIVAFNDDGPTAGPVWSFTTESSPNSASNPQPHNGARNILTSQALSWDAQPNAARYIVYFDTDSSLPSGIQQSSSANSFNPTLSFGTTYYWRVDTYNASGTTTGSLWHFRTMNLPAPARYPNPQDTATNVLTGQILNWCAAAGATSYDVYFDTANPPSFVQNQTDNSFTLFMNPGTAYYWQVNPINAAGTTSGPIWSFTTACLPGQPSDNSNYDYVNEDVTADGMLTWDVSANATSYSVFFGTSSSNVTFVSDVTTNQFSLTDLPYDLNPGATYYWRIVAKNVSGQVTGEQWLLVAGPPLAVNPNPPDDAPGVSFNPRLSWTCSGAVGYRVYFGTADQLQLMPDSTYAPPQKVAFQTTSSYTPGLLDASTDYFWRVDSKDVNGVWTPGTVWYSYHDLKGHVI